MQNWIRKLISAVRHIARNAYKAVRRDKGVTIHLVLNPKSDDREIFTEDSVFEVHGDLIVGAAVELTKIEEFLDEIGVPHSEAVFPRVKLMYETLTNSKEGNDGQTGS